jgi:hypothetical protein
MSLTGKDIIESNKGVGTPLGSKSLSTTFGSNTLIRSTNIGELTQLANKWGAILLIDDANSIFDFNGKDAREGMLSSIIRYGFEVYNGNILIVQFPRSH